MYYAEIGFGNKNLISTEVEIGDLEYRLNKFVVKKILGVYLRIWIKKKVFVLGIPRSRVLSKEINNFKILLGVTSK